MGRAVRKLARRLGGYGDGWPAKRRDVRQRASLSSHTWVGPADADRLEALLDLALFLACRESDFRRVAE
jgi:hypothetical protein